MLHLLRRARRRATVFLWRGDPSRTAVRLAAVAALVLLPLSSCMRRPAVLAERPLPAEEDAYADIREDGGVVSSPRMPEAPLAWQKRPPCDVDMGETAVNGACYIVIGRSPPCGPKLIEYRGLCYRAIAKAKTPPVSGQE